MVVERSEAKRIWNHLWEAERAARRSATALDPLKRRVRGLLLDELARYRRAGRFPRNYEFRTHRVPYFVDPHGTRCAVAHLLDIGGKPALVEKIARTRNNARVHELADEPELVRFLAAAGLTLEEAARIQPGYSCSHDWHSTPSDCMCTYDQVNVAVGVVLKTATRGNPPDGLVQVERAFGITAPTVGEEWAAYTTSTPGARAFYTRAGDYLREVPTIQLVSGNAQCAGLAVAEDVAIDALLASPEECRSLLEREDPQWTDLPCSEEAGGCQLAGMSGAAATPATIAILVALLAYRRARKGRTQ